MTPTALEQSRRISLAWALGLFWRHVPQRCQCQACTVELLRETYSLTAHFVGSDGRVVS